MKHLAHYATALAGNPGSDICEQAGLDVMGVETRRGGHIAVHTAQGILFCPGTPKHQSSFGRHSGSSHFRTVCS